MQDYTRLKVLGEGGFARVYLATHRPTGRLVALKVSRSSSHKHGQANGRRAGAAASNSASFSAGNSAHHASLKADVVRGEILALMRAGVQDVPGVCRLEGVVLGEGEVGLVMELIRGESLAVMLRKRGGRVRLSEEAVRVVRRQLACALSNLHACGVLHRDVKPSNVVVDELGHARLVDFGLAVIDQLQKDDLAARLENNKPPTTVSDVAASMDTSERSGPGTGNKTWNECVACDDLRLAMPTYAPLALHSERAQPFSRDVTDGADTIRLIVIPLAGRQ